MSTTKRYGSFPSAKEDAISSEKCLLSAQTCSPSYQLSYTDTNFILRDELRPVRLQLELMKPEILQQEHDVKATVVVFGGARIPDEETAQKKLLDAQKAVDKEPANQEKKRKLEVAKRVLKKAGYYNEARKLGRLLSETCHKTTGCKLVVITGGGPGIMEAANRGAHDVGAKNVGLNIVLPHEQAPNPYITPELCFQFHYFSIRKMHFLMRARALVAFPGGFGTLDELFETLTLIQTKKIKPVPVLLFGREYWDKAIDFNFLAEEGVISAEDLDIFRYVETAEEAVEIISSSFNSI